MAAVADNHVFHDVIQRTGIDADAAYRDLLASARSQMIDLQSLAGFQYKGIFQPGKA